MYEIKLYKSRWKAIKLLALTLPFVAIGLWMATKNPNKCTDQIAGWFNVCFFGMGLPIGLFNLFDRRPKIIITETGIWDRSFKQAEIKWEDIESAYPFTVSKQKFIGLTPPEVEEFLDEPDTWVTKINAAIGAQRLNLHLGQISIDQLQLTDFINAMIFAEPEVRRTLILNAPWGKCS
jgi:hypothetical protein